MSILENVIILARLILKALDDNFSILQWLSELFFFPGNPRTQTGKGNGIFSEMSHLCYGMALALSHSWLVEEKELTQKLFLAYIPYYSIYYMALSVLWDCLGSVTFSWLMSLVFESCWSVFSLFYRFQFRLACVSHVIVMTEAYCT